MLKKVNTFRDQAMPIMIDNLTPKKEKLPNENDLSKNSPQNNSSKSMRKNGLDDEEEFRSATDSGALELQNDSNKNNNSSKVVPKPAGFFEGVKQASDSVR